MSELEIIFLVGIVAYGAFKAGVWFAANAAAAIMDKLGVTEEELQKAGVELGLDEEVEEDDNTVWFKIEKHGETLYSYRTETEQFIAQSDDPQGLVDRMIERFPKGTMFRIAKEDGSEYIEHLPEG